jgi:xylulokinase
MVILVDSRISRLYNNCILSFENKISSSVSYQNKMTSNPENQPLLLGIDLGISTAKAALFTPAGELLGLESDEYLILPEGDRVEADPEIYWRPLAGCIRRLLQKWGGQPEQIASVSVSTHTETLIPLAGSGAPSRKALVWMDSRSQPEADEMAEVFGVQRLLEISGQPDIGPIWPATKLRWLSKHEPDSLRRTSVFLLPGDYLIYRLCGELCAEDSLWSSSLVLDIRRKALDAELLEFCGVSASQIPPIYPAGARLGRISPACAAETGLSQNTVVVSGALDQVCAALGAGNISPGAVTESTGSVVALVATTQQPVFDAVGKVPCHIHAIPGVYAMLPWNPTGGLTLKWFKDRFAQDQISEAATHGQDIYDLLTESAGQVAPGSGGLVMLPHLEGAFYPEYNPQARAAFFGFTLSHTQAHFTRAILEAVAFMIRRDLEGIQRLGVPVRELRVLGGGAKSRLWSQIKADVCQLPVIMPRHREASVLGAAILAATGAGLYPDIPSAVQEMARTGLQLDPNPEHREVYEQAFRLYTSLYESLQPLFPASVELQRLGDQNRKQL